MSCEIQPAPQPTSQPTNRAPNEPAMDKMPILGQIGSFLGQKILLFTGEIKSFVTHITENPPRHLVHIGFGGHWTISWPKITKNAYLDQIWPFWGQNPNFMGVNKGFGTNITENHLDNLSALFLVRP